MGKFNKTGKRGMPELNTSSLPDLIFTMLFFFMIVTTMREVTLKVQFRVPLATELEKLEKIVNEKLELVRKLRDSFGWDCFTEEVEQEINVLRKLEDLLIFSREPDDLNEQVAELEDEDPKTYSMICRFEKAQLTN